MAGDHAGRIRGVIVLNRLWTSFFLIAALVALGRAWQGDSAVFARIVAATFDSAKTGFEISLGLTGVMCLWLGLMRIGEQAGLVGLLTRGITPLFSRLLPEVPRGHPAQGSITLNMAANMLGLDNAATPAGLKAMGELQQLNTQPERASDAQILFLVINASSVTLLPATIFTYRAQLGAADPTDVFIPILLATYCSTLAGLLATATMQRVPLLDRVVLAYIGGITGLVVLLAAYFGSLPAAQMREQSALLANVVIFGLIVAFLLAAARARIDAFAAFVEGGKAGFQIAIGVVPYLIAMLVAIGVLRASGALDSAMAGIRYVAGLAGWDTRWVDALPTALIKPFSGSGARGMMIDAMKTHGADSFAGRLACIIQGSTETTFYVVAVYFGSVGIKQVRHAVTCALIADAAGVAGAIAAAYLFFG